MSAKPTLAYWKYRGIAQPIRLLLNYIGQEFEDVKFEMGEGPEFSREEWLSKKFSYGLEFPNLPFYIDGDVKITQSNAILMYLGRKHDLVGKSESERILIDMLLNHFMDVVYVVAEVKYNPKCAEMLDGLFAKLKNDQLPLLEKHLEGKTWFVGDRITVADFPFYELLDVVRNMKADLLDDFPKLRDFLSRFEALPAIKEYMESDRFMKNPINNKCCYILNK